MNEHNVSEFDLRVDLTSLLPLWQILLRAVDKESYYAFTKLASWSTRRGKDVLDVTEADLLAFGAAYEAAGRQSVDVKVERIRSIVAKLRRNGSTFPLPSLAAPQKRQTPRKDQYANLPQAFKDDFHEHFALCMPNATSASQISRKNFLLRMIALAEGELGKGGIARLFQIWSKNSLRAMKNANWGDTDGNPQDPTSSGVHNRSKLLEIGVQNARKVLKDPKLAKWLKGVHKKGVKRSNEIPGEKIEAVGKISTEVLRKIASHARAVIREFVAGLGGPHDLERAQIAVAILVVLVTCFKRGDVMKVKFAGPPRKIPGKISIERPELVQALHTATSLEEEMTAETTALIDAYWLAFWRRTGEPPVWLLGHRDGEEKSAAAFPNGVAKFGKSIGIKVTPEMLRIAVVAGMYRGNVSREDIAAILGIKQLVNLDSRFGVFKGADAADKLETILEENPAPDEDDE
ncbi:hypothetical protein [uncultured Rhodoblastus sp.]|uniref:hypothetical protein n=1 Tax=uncultured Rhodoblastus sp. TaxID=543037 RepID=UPI0025E2E1D4|nr:hypothetical protein [uncultured Rhodoblastus sp.]